MEVNFSIQNFWSISNYGDNYRASARMLPSQQCTNGMAYVDCDRFRGLRLLHWKAGAGVICFQEAWFEKDMFDNAACFRFGEPSMGSPLCVNVESVEGLSPDDVCVCIRLLLRDGSVCIIKAFAPSTESSLLTYFVEKNQGMVVDISTFEESEADPHSVYKQDQNTTKSSAIRCSPKFRVGKDNTKSAQGCFLDRVALLSMKGGRILCMQIGVDSRNGRPTIENEVVVDSNSFKQGDSEPLKANSANNEDAHALQDKAAQRDSVRLSGGGRGMIEGITSLFFAGDRESSSEAKTPRGAASKPFQTDKTGADELLALLPLRQDSTQGRGFLSVNERGTVRLWHVSAAADAPCVVHCLEVLPLLAEMRADGQEAPLNCIGLDEVLLVLAHPEAAPAASAQGNDLVALGLCCRCKEDMGGYRLEWHASLLCIDYARAVAGLGSGFGLLGLGKGPYLRWGIVDLGEAGNDAVDCFRLSDLAFTLSEATASYHGEKSRRNSRGVDSAEVSLVTRWQRVLGEGAFPSDRRFVTNSLLKPDAGYRAYSVYGHDSAFDYGFDDDVGPLGAQASTSGLIGEMHDELYVMTTINALALLEPPSGKSMSVLNAVNPSEVVKTPLTPSSLLLMDQDFAFSHCRREAGGWGAIAAPLGEVDAEDKAASKGFEVINAECSADETVLRVKAHRLQRLFLPGRFSLSSVLDALLVDVPIDTASKILSQAQEVSLTVVADCTVVVCEEWAEDLLEQAKNNVGVAMEEDEDESDEELRHMYAQCLDLAFLELTRLCTVRQNKENVRRGGPLFPADQHFMLNALCFSFSNDCEGVGVVPLEHGFKLLMRESSRKKSDGSVDEGRFEQPISTIANEVETVHKSLRLLAVGGPRHRFYRVPKVHPGAPESVINQRLFLELDLSLCRALQDSQGIDHLEHVVQSACLQLATSLTAVVPQIRDLLTPANVAMKQEVAASFLDSAWDEQLTLLANSSSPRAQMTPLAQITAVPVSGVYSNSQSRNRSGSSSSHNEMAATLSSLQSALVSGIADMSIATRYEEAKLVCILYALLSLPNNINSAADADHAKRVFFRKAVHNLLYFGLLRWMGTLRPADVSMLRRSFDPSDLFPLSCAVPRTQQRESSEGDAFRLIGSLNNAASGPSVLAGFWRSREAISGLCRGWDGNRSSLGSSLAWLEGAKLVPQISRLLRPGTLGPLSGYLLMSGQFCALARLSALLAEREKLWDDVGVTLEPEQRQLLQISQFFVTARSATMGALATFYELLRQQTVLQHRGVGLSEHDQGRLRSVVEKLLTECPPPMMFSPLEQEAAAAVMDTEGSPDPMFEELSVAVLHKKITLWTEIALRAVPPDNSYVGVARRDAISCAEDALFACCERSSTFRAFLSAVFASETTTQSARGASVGTDDFILKHSSMLLSIAAVVHRQTVLEIVKRSRVVLSLSPARMLELPKTLENAANSTTHSPASPASEPALHHIGAELALRAAYSSLQAITALSTRLDDVEEPVTDLVHSALMETIQREVLTSWERILNFSLEAERLDEALGAIIELAELDPSGNGPVAAAHAAEDCSTAASSSIGEDTKLARWRAALRSLVALACETGHLDWLCDLHEVRLGPARHSLIGVVAEELRRLAESRGLPIALLTNGAVGNTGSGEGVNYYDSLFALHATHGCYTDAATILHDLQLRLLANFAMENTKGTSAYRYYPRNASAACVTTAHLSHYAAASSAALSLVPPMQRALLITSLGDSDASQTKEATKNVSCVPEQQLASDFLRARASKLHAEHLHRLSQAEMTTGGKYDTVALSQALRELPCLRDEVLQLIQSLLDSENYVACQLALVLALHEMERLTAVAPGFARDPGMPAQQEHDWCGRLLGAAQCAMSALTNLNLSPDAEEGRNWTSRALPQERAWKELAYVLQAMDSASIGWALHRSCIETLSRMSNRIGDVPADVLSSYCGSHDYCFLLSQSGKVTSLLRALSKGGLVTKACCIATKALQATTKVLQQGGSHQICVPYEILDSLLLQTKRASEKFTPADASEVGEMEELTKARHCLEAAMTVYFETLCIAEHTGF